MAPSAFRTRNKKIYLSSSPPSHFLKNIQVYVQPWKTLAVRNYKHSQFKPPPWWRRPANNKRSSSFSLRKSSCLAAQTVNQMSFNWSIFVFLQLMWLTGCRMSQIVSFSRVVFIQHSQVCRHPPPPCLKGSEGSECWIAFKTFAHSERAVCFWNVPLVMWGNCVFWFQIPENKEGAKSEPDGEEMISVFVWKQKL